jgi:hypothetical protein
VEFKDAHLKDQFDAAPTLLKLAIEEIDFLAKKFGKSAIVTRVTDAVEGESGVHLDHRAVDIRDEYMGKFVFTENERLAILHYINARYPRNDGKQTIIWHSFGGGPHHFHVQVAATTKTHMSVKA